MENNDARLPVFELILDAVNRKKRSDRAFVLGISGIDAAGKTTFALAFDDFLKSKSISTGLIHLDHFHNPQAYRYAGKDRADNYFNRSFNIGEIVDKLLLPIRHGGEYSVELTHLDVAADSYTVKKHYSFTPETVVIFEGVFLFRNELAGFIDYKVFLDISFDLSKERAVLRNEPMGDEGLKLYDDKYIPGQKRYLAAYPPSRTADLILDNTDYEHPEVTGGIRGEL